MGFLIDFDTSQFTTLALAYLIPFIVVFAIWCVILTKLFHWRPFHIAKHIIARQHSSALTSISTNLRYYIWIIFYFLPYAIVIAFAFHLTFAFKPYNLGIAIGISLLATMFLILTVHYYSALGYNLTRRVKALFGITIILFLGGYIAIIISMDPINWMASGYLCLMPSLVVYALCICLERRKFTKGPLHTVYESEENRNDFVADLEADRFDEWFTGSGKMTWYSGLIVILSSVAFCIAFYFIWRGKDEELATIGTIASSLLVDVLLVVSQYKTVNFHNTLLLLFIGYIVKMIIVTFSSNYWFIGHGILFFVFATYYVVKLLNWLILAYIAKYENKANQIPEDVKLDKEILEAIENLQPDYKRLNVGEIILTIISLVILSAAAVFELHYYDSSKLVDLPFNMTQHDAYLSLVVLSLIFGCVFGVFYSIKNNKYDLTWPMALVFLIASGGAGCFSYLYNGFDGTEDFRILAFLVFYFIFGTIFEAFIINGNGKRLFKEGGFKEFDNIASLFFLILDIGDAACLIALPWIYGTNKELGLEIFFGISTVFMYILFCSSFLPLQHLTWTTFLCLILYFVTLAALCITIFVDTKEYYGCIAIASIYIVICLVVFAILWTWFMDWRYTLGPMLIISIVTLACAAVSICGYIFLEEYDTYCILASIVMFMIFFGSLLYYVLHKNDFIITWGAITLTVLWIILVVVSIILLFFELKSFFASLSALLVVIYCCSLLIIGGLIGTTSKTDVIIFSDLFIPVRRLFNGVMKTQSFFRFNCFTILVIPFFWGMVATTILKESQYGSLAMSAGIAIFAFMMLTFIYDFDSNALNSVEYMKLDAIDFAVNKALTISGNEIGVDELPPKDRDNYETFMKYIDARKASFLDHSKFVSALKAQLYITAEIAFEKNLEKIKAFCADHNITLDFLRQKEFTAHERKLLFAFGEGITKGNTEKIKERDDYLSFVRDQEEKRQARLANSLKDAKKAAEKYAKVIGTVLKDKKFADPEFHPNNSSSISEPKAKLDKCEWKRAEDEFKGEFIGNTSPNDLCQGSLGDCYLISAMAAISVSPKIVSNVFETPIKINETGAACVSMHAMGKDIKIIVDSTLPFKKDKNEPKFVKPRNLETTSWWFTIVEKAYAKQNGSYSAIIGGNSHVALHRLLGGWPENFDLGSLEMKEQINNGMLWKNILKWFNQNDFLCCGSNSGSDTCKNSNNIVLGHAYSIHNVKEIKGFKLLQLRNPWGDGEWSGDWSDKSPLWGKYPAIAKALNHTDEDDGMFWIDFKDFCSNYSSLYICLDLESRNWFHYDIRGKLSPGEFDGAKPVTKGPGANRTIQYLVKFRKPTKVRLTFEKTGPNAAIWVYAVYNKGQQVKKLFKGMQYKTEAVAQNAVLQSFEWDFQQNEIEFPWNFIICRNKSEVENDWLLRLWTTEEIDPVEELPPSEGAPDAAAIPATPAKAAVKTVDNKAAAKAAPAKPAPAKAAPKPAAKPAKAKGPAKA